MVLALFRVQLLAQGLKALVLMTGGVILISMLLITILLLLLIQAMPSIMKIECPTP